MSEAMSGSSSGSSGEEYAHFFEVKLDLFDGPIDLLLHLVKQNELPIEKLSLAAIADQYFQCIERAKQYDLEIAGEYLVIAATLLSIKASILLNEPVVLVEDDDGNLSDPHEELLRKLKEAAVYREGAQKLAGRDLLGVDVFAGAPLLEQFEAPAVKLKQHDPMLLGKAFQKLLAQAGPGKLTFTISVDSVTIVERMMSVIDLLKKNDGSIVFYKLIPDVTSRNSVIGTFLALLELCKRQVISVRQEDVFNEISIVLGASDADVKNLASEYDINAPRADAEKVANAE